MKIWLLATAVALLTGTSVAAPRVDPEARLARAVEGRVAGKPVDCINLRDIRSTRVIDRTAIVYDAGSTIYVNRPRSGQTSLDRSDVMVTRNYSDRLCSIDTIRLVDSASRMPTGVVFLGEFVPYKRAARPE